MAAGAHWNRRRLPVLLCLLVALVQPAAAFAERNRVVFHLNSGDPDKQHSVLRNLDNHIAAVGAGNLELKVMLQGGGVALLLLPEALPRVRMGHANADPAMREHVDALRGQGVVFLVSGHTLAKHGIHADRDLYGVSPRQVVPNALSYLSELQRRGYAYIKP